MGIEYKCIDFSSTAFADILAMDYPGLGKDQNQINSKRHSGYFQRYLQDLGCKTILVEYPYIDRDYLEDYCSYYARCFTGYDRQCVRLHFFDSQFGDEDFFCLLKREDGKLTHEILKNSYLGFVVINPLPSTYIGRTCLKTFGDDGGRRSYLATRCYTVHLLGITLSIKSLAFQEQDSTVAACATSALWSAFHGSGILFQHSIPSPVEITKIATQYIIQEKRSFPNHALTFYQITHAIKKLNLEPLTIRLNHNCLSLQSNVYAYISAGLPVLLLVVDAKKSAGHAITVSGFSLGLSVASSPPGFPAHFKLVSTQIDKLYVHDDQTGPFARASLFNATGGFDTYNEIDGYAFKYEILVIPIYHKIRIEYEAIQNAVFHFHEAFSYVANECGFARKPSCWDIRLASSIEFKKTMHNDDTLKVSERLRSLQKELPRFIWIAIARDDKDNLPVLGLVFDATDITDGCLLVHDIEYELPFIPALREALDSDPADGVSLPGIKRIQTWLRQLKDD